MGFRYDINGLRAFAVLAVVLFHFNPQWLPGGFAGVDVFFVISGFLMTSIIFNGIEKNTFNLFKFYNARANRIIPVLAAMSVVLLIFGWFYLLPDNYRDLGEQAQKSSIFRSNTFFSKGGGYFDTDENTKWLLHTWSLSVEWQFYIFFPLIIIALKKYLSFTNLKRVVIVLFLVSFIYCVHKTLKDSRIAYFLLKSRAWEMLLGGLAFLYPWSLKSKLHQISTQCFGLILIVASYFLISKDTPWPGYMALIPVFGAYLVIVSNYQNNILINNPIFNYIGKWSYSIYVWHWPLVVFGFYFVLKDWWMYGIPLSILLGFLSYYFIEKVKLNKFNSWKDIYKVKPLYIFLVAFSLGNNVRVTNGFEFHYSKDVLNVVNERNNSNPYDCAPINLHINNVHECKIGNQKNIKAIVVGDSHADSLTTSISSNLNLKNEGLLVIAASGCPFIPNGKFESSYNFCSELNKKRNELLNNYPNVPIIFINRYLQKIEGENDPDRTKTQRVYFTDKNVSKDKIYMEFERNLKVTTCNLTKKSPVYIVLPIPEVGFNVPEKMAKQLLINKRIENTFLPLSDYQNRSKRLNKILYSIADNCGAKVLNPTEILCKNKECITQYKGRSIYRDGDHLSEYGNKLLTPMFKQALQP